MYTQRRTPFGTENIISGSDAVANQRGSDDAARLAAAQALQAQLALQAQMHQGDLADRQAGRAQQGQQFERTLGFEGEQAKANQDFQLNRDRLGTERAYGLADKQNEPELNRQRLGEQHYNAEHGFDNALNEMLMRQLQNGSVGEQDAVNLSLGGSGTGSAPSANGAPAGGGFGGGLMNSLVRHKLGLGEDPNEAFNRAVKQHMIQTAMDTLATTKDPKQAAKLSAFLKAQGVGDMEGFYTPPTGADARAQADAANNTYFNSGIIKSRIDSTVPALIQSAKQDPGGIAFAVQRIANQFAQEAGKEGGDPGSLAPQILKMLSDKLAPELERLRPGFGSELVKRLAAASVPNAGVPYAPPPAAADVLKQQLSY